jgi:hypothetical protein
MNKLLIAVAVAATLSACATSSPDVVSRNEAQRLSQIQDATVLSVRPVVIDGSQSGAGAVTGGVVGGIDTWMNCITACRACNGRKGNRMPEEARMSLLYLPYVPSLHEDMILRGRRILVDQMDFLLASVPRSSRLHG